MCTATYTLSKVPILILSPLWTKKFIPRREKHVGDSHARQDLTGTSQIMIETRTVLMVLHSLLNKKFFPASVEYSYFSSDFRLKILFWMLNYGVWNFWFIDFDGVEVIWEPDCKSDMSVTLNVLEKCDYKVASNIRLELILLVFS